MKTLQVVFSSLSILYAFTASATEIKNRPFVKAWQEHKFLTNKKNKSANFIKRCSFKNVKQRCPLLDSRSLELLFNKKNKDCMLTLHLKLKNKDPLSLTCIQKPFNPSDGEVGVDIEWEVATFFVFYKGSRFLYLEYRWFNNDPRMGTKYLYRISSDKIELLTSKSF